jgi:hypothetical protein
VRNGHSLFGRLPALHYAASHTPSTSMPVCRVAPDLGVRRGGNSQISQPQPCGPQDCYCTQARQSFHVTNDTKVTTIAEVTFEIQVTNDASTNVAIKSAALDKEFASPVPLGGNIANQGSGRAVPQYGYRPTFVARPPSAA